MTANLIATNFHVIDGAVKGIARLVNKGTAYPLEGRAGADEINDLALLRVTIHGVIPLSLGDSDKVQTGQTVYVAGNPLGFDGTFSDGIVSSRRNTYGIERLQMTAPISPGSSGGPVLNTSGEVIGVSVSTFSPLFGQNLNFAIPSNSLRELLTRSRQAKPMLYSKQTTSADTFRQRGWEKIRLGDYNGALVDFANAIRLSPDNSVLYAMRGHAKHSLRQYASAVDDYNTAIRLNPDLIQMKRTLTSDVGTQERKSINLMRPSLIMTQPSDLIQMKLQLTCGGWVKEQLNRFDAAIADYDTAIRLNPNYSYAYEWRGKTKEELNQIDAAIADYDTAIRLAPEDSSAYFYRGNAKSVLEQHFAAISDYDIAIRLDPEDAAGYLNRGASKAALNQYSAAIADYDIAIRLNPDLALAYKNRGLSKYTLNQVHGAKQDLNIALKLAKQQGNHSVEAGIQDWLRRLD